jgi:dUTP pyrophosphatase
VTLKVQRLDPGARLPALAHEGDAGYDLHALEPAQLGPGERAAVRTGNRGEVKVLLLNTDRTEAFTIAAGDRIAQLVLVAVQTPAVEEVAALTASVRGEGGFGSSGR